MGAASSWLQQQQPFSTHSLAHFDYVKTADNALSLSLSLFPFENLLSTFDFIFGVFFLCCSAQSHSLHPLSLICLIFIMPFSTNVTKPMCYVMPFIQPNIHTLFTSSILCLCGIPFARSKSMDRVKERTESNSNIHRDIRRRKRKKKKTLPHQE